MSAAGARLKIGGRGLREVGQRWQARGSVVGVLTGLAAEAGGLVVEAGGLVVETGGKIASVIVGEVDASRGDNVQTPMGASPDATTNAAARSKNDGSEPP